MKIYGNFRFLSNFFCYQKKQIMDLKKQISEERNLAAVMLSKMKAETDDYQRAQQTAIIKQQQVYINI